MGHQALDGLRVIDLSPTQVGAQISQTLADFGAEVVWVEPPGGSPLRQRPAFPFLARGKRSLVADVHSAAGLDRIRDLAGHADVLIETFRPGVMDRVGLGFDELTERNPALIYTSVTGFGRSGPWSHLPGYEGVVAALVGLSASFSQIHAGSHPPFLSVPWCSFAASQVALQGTLAALFERERSGRGQWVEANLAHAFGTIDPWNWFQYLVTQRYPDAYAAAPVVDEKWVPNSPMSFSLITSQTKDGRWLQFAQNSPRLFDALLRAMGLDEVVTDPAWRSIATLEDEQRRADLWPRMLKASQQRTLAEWQELFVAQHDVLGELYRRGPEVLDHPQLAATGAVVHVDDPDGNPVRQPGPIAVLNASPAVVATPAPALDEAADIAWTRTTRPPVRDSARRSPLDGVTVLELAVLYAAPYAATLLADLGARVIKVETLAGDPGRPMAGFPEVGCAKATQGKESVAVDLSRPEGREIVYRLARRADLVLEGYRSGVAERLGVDAETLRGINPELFYLSASGYGPGGPYGDRPAFAPSIGAAGGIAAAHLGETPDETIVDIDDLSRASARMRAGATSRYANSDGLAALGAGTALLLGLVARQRGAGGQHAFTSMLNTSAHAIADHVIERPGSAGPPAPGPDLRGPSACYRSYDAADGWVFLAAPQPREWDRLADALAPYVDLRADSRFATAGGRQRYDDALAEVLGTVFKARSKDQWQQELTAAGVACVAVWTGDLEDLFMNDVGRASGYVVDAEHPTFGTHPRLAPMVRFSRSATRADGGTLCGAATQAVLTELGYSAEQIADLRAQRVVG